MCIHKTALLLLLLLLSERLPLDTVFVRKPRTFRYIEATRIETLTPPQLTGSLTLKFIHKKISEGFFLVFTAARSSTLLIQKFSNNTNTHPKHSHTPYRSVLHNECRPSVTHRCAEFLLQHTERRERAPHTTGC